MTEIANPTLGKAEDLFKSFVWDPMVKSAIAAFFVACAWLNVPVVSNVLSYLFTMFSDFFYSKTRLILDLGSIAFVNDEHRKEFDSVASRLLVLQHDFGLNSDQYKKAREDAKADLSKYMHFNGA